MSLFATDLFRQQHPIDEKEVRDIVWRVSVYGIIFENNKVLLMPAVKEKSYSLPGGEVELTETFTTAVEREVEEETGLAVKAGRFLDVRENLFIWEPDSPTERSVMHTVLLYYSCSKIDGQLSTASLDEWEKENMGNAEWVSLDDIDTLPIFGSIDFRDIIRKARNHGN